MPSDPSRFSSVACLLYLAADQLVPRGHERKDAEGNEGPLPARLSTADPAAATIMAATLPEAARRRKSQA
jgi:hypothetical protein